MGLSYVNFNDTAAAAAAESRVLMKNVDWEVF
jgi:hypothetical protein